MNRSALSARAASLLLAASLGVLAGCDRKSADAAPASSAPAAVMVGAENVAVVESTELASGPPISGNLQAEREATVRAEISGAVLQTYADQGSRVGRGTMIVRLNDATQRDAFLSARSGLTTAQMAADIAKRELERQEKLAAAGAIAERELESSRRSNVAAQSQLADAQARLTLAREQLENAEVRAPFNGIVSTRQVSAGDVVQPGGALFTIVDPSSMRLEGSVAADQLSAVRIGAPVSFTVSGYPGQKFIGKVTRINPTADPSTGQVRIVASIPNASNNLVGGLFADGRVASDQRRALTVPFGAVDVRGVRPSVLLVKNGKTERREVAVGIRDEEAERLEIVSGVAAGDTLLIGAAQGISPGTPVRVSAPSDEAPKSNTKS
jgi:RND family efflux transporter MFP subunit